MAYEVIKTVKGRRYRYRVESYRDESGKARGKWTCLGPADAEAGGPPVPSRTEQTRRRLLDALERLLEREEYARVTAAAVAKEAGLGHGTFYLHFHDVRDALRAAVQTVRDGLSTVLDTSTPVAERSEERGRIEAWLRALLASSAGKSGLVRAYSALVAQDGEIALEHGRRRHEWLRGFARYLRALQDAGLARVDDADALARMVLGLVDGVIRLAVLDRAEVGERLRAYVTRTVDRAIFED